jgi:outer membrane protein assembly factor BamB
MMKGLRTFVLMLLFVPAAHAGDWPQWLGPNRDGSSTEKVAAWKEPLKVLWKQPVGEGHSAPVVAKGHVFLHTRVKNKLEESVSAFDAKTGELAWESVPIVRAKFADPFGFGTGPRGTPAMVDGKLYALGITGILSCVDTASGKLVWEVDPLKKYKASNLVFGISCSPLVVDDLVLVSVGGKGASIVAFDRMNGEERWKALDDSASYSSPIVLGKGKERQVVFLTGKRLVSLYPFNGGLIWDYPLVDKLQESSTTPVVSGDIMFASSVTFGGVALKNSAGDKGPTAKELWVNPAYNCYFSTPVAIGEQLYLVTGSLLAQKATLRCIETATGKELWKHDNVGKYHASLLRTGDGKLLMLEEAGDLVLLQPDPKEYRELSRSKICGETWAHPALADGRLYVRDKKDLICVDLPR